MTRYLKTKKKKTKRRTSSPIILYDDREKQPWTFLQATGYNWQMERTRLKTADYTFKGFEKKVAIEKKSGLAELYSDLTAKNRPTFKNFLLRLSEFQIKAIIVEDDLSNVAKCVSIMKAKSRGKCQLTEATIYFWISRITVDYKIPVLFTGLNLRTQCRLIHQIFTEAYECLS